jgi:hypothetical protein
VSADPTMKARALVGSAVLVLALVLGTEGLLSAGVVWKADFETGDISQFNGNVNATNKGRTNIEIVSDPVRQGKAAAKLTLHPDDTFAARQMRVQLTRHSPRTGEGQDLFLSFYLRMNEAPLARDNFAYWESDESWRNMMTWWVEPREGGGATINFGTGNLGPSKHWTADFTPGRWHQLAMHIRWSTNPQAGRIKLWYDGKVVVDIPAQTKADANPMFFQPGVHRAERSSAVDTLFFDDFVEGDTLADIRLIKPDRRASGVPPAGR